MGERNDCTVILSRIMGGLCVVRTVLPKESDPNVLASMSRGTTETPSIGAIFLTTVAWTLRLPSGHVHVPRVAGCLSTWQEVEAQHFASIQKARRPRVLAASFWAAVMYWGGRNMRARQK